MSDTGEKVMADGLSEQDILEIRSVCPRLYDAVGWGEDRTPNWEEFRRCCHMEAVLVPMGSGAASPIPLETFIEGMEQQRTSGALIALSERELGNSVQGFGNLASVRSTFSATIDGVERRGVTFALLVREDGRWVIISVAWENERDDRPLPADFV
jgi:hypothetical protein